MKTNKATCAVILFTERAKKDGSYPLKLRITFRRERKYYSTGRDLTSEQWDKMNGGKARGFLKDLKAEIIETEKKADSIIEEFTKNDEEFSFIRFEKKFFDEHEFPTMESKKKMNSKNDL